MASGPTLLEEHVSIPYPAGASALAFKIGAPVRISIDQRNLLPAIGTVYAVNPKTNKIFVAWPTGGNTQHAPDELSLVPPEQGLPTVVAPAPGYSSWEVAKSEKLYGALTPASLKKCAATLTSSVMSGSASELARGMRKSGSSRTDTMDSMLSVYTGILASDKIACIVEEAYQD